MTIVPKIRIGLCFLLSSILALFLILSCIFNATCFCARTGTFMFVRIFLDHPTLLLLLRRGSIHAYPFYGSGGSSAEFIDALRPLVLFFPGPKGSSTHQVVACFSAWCSSPLVFFFLDYFPLESPLRVG